MLEVRTVKRKFGDKEGKWYEEITATGFVDKEPEVRVLETNNGPCKICDNANIKIIFPMNLEKNTYRLVFWEKTAEIFSQFAIAWSKVFIRGELVKTEYNGKTYESIRVDTFEVLESKDQTKNRIAANREKRKNKEFA